MEWRRREFGTLTWSGEGFEPRRFGASRQPREGEKQATSDPRPRMVTLFKTRRAGTNGLDAHLTHDVLATAPFVMRHVDVQRLQPPRLPQRIRKPEPMGRDTAARGQVAPRSKPREIKSRGAGHQLAVIRWPQPVRSRSWHVLRRPAKFHGT
jgi:hypothetical protein